MSSILAFVVLLHPQGVPMTAGDVISKVDGLYQAAFADLALTEEVETTVRDPDGTLRKVKLPGKFGMSRVPDFLSGHVTWPLEKGQRPIYNRLREEKWTVVTTLFGRKGKPVREGDLTARRSTPYTEPSRSLGPDKVPPSEVMERLASLGRHGQVMKESTTDWWLESRVVRLSKKECLPCHEGSQLGDPIAVLIHAAKRGPVKRP